MFLWHRVVKYEREADTRSPNLFLHSVLLVFMLLSSAYFHWGRISGLCGKQSSTVSTKPTAMSDDVKMCHFIKLKNEFYRE